MPKSILFALLLLVATTAYGRRTIDTYFISAPTQLLPQLDANNRKDLIDLFDAGLESRITGPLGGNIEIGSIDDRQITVHFSPASTLQIALLPTADTVGVIAVIHTVDLPAPDSRITFYDTQWNPIENDELFIAPTPETFLSKGPKKEKRQAAGWSRSSCSSAAIRTGATPGQVAPGCTCSIVRSVAPSIYFV